MEHVEFSEDKFISKKSNQEKQLPEKGIEGWLYKKIPGSPLVKKIVLIVLILLLFGMSVGISMLSKVEIKPESTENNFQERIKSTQLR